jgi:hypothetical protein
MVRNQRLQEALQAALAVISEQKTDIALLEGHLRDTRAEIQEVTDRIPVMDAEFQTLRDAALAEAKDFRVPEPKASVKKRPASAVQADAPCEASAEPMTMKRPSSDTMAREIQDINTKTEQSDDKDHKSEHDPNHSHGSHEQHEPSSQPEHSAVMKKPATKKLKATNLDTSTIHFFRGSNLAFSDSDSLDFASPG